QAHLGDGEKGTSFRALDQDSGLAVEIRTLNGVREEAVRWLQLSRRLRLASELDHPATIPGREFSLESEPPLLAPEWVEGPSLAGQLRDTVPLPVPQALSLARELAGALATAHRLGLAHGGLVPSAIRMTGPHQPKIDLTAISAHRVGPGPFHALDASCL